MKFSYLSLLAAIIVSTPTIAEHKALKTVVNKNTYHIDNSKKTVNRPTAKAHGGKVIGSGNSKNHNKNTAFGKGVGIGKGGSSRVKVNTRLNNRNTINQAQNTDQSNDQSLVIQGDSNVQQFEAQRRNPANTAYAAPLISSNDTCMGSTSVGGQGITFGVSFATTWRDRDCVIRKDARFLHNADREVIALSLMCEKDSVRRAVERAGNEEERAVCGISPAVAPQSKVVLKPLVSNKAMTIVPVVNKLKDDRGVGVFLGK